MSKNNHQHRKTKGFKNKKGYTIIAYIVDTTTKQIGLS